MLRLLDLRPLVDMWVSLLLRLVRLDYLMMEMIGRLNRIWGLDSLMFAFGSGYCGVYSSDWPLYFGCFCQHNVRDSTEQLYLIYHEVSVILRRE